MLRKNIFKLMCFILVTFASCLFTFTNNRSHAESETANAFSIISMVEALYDDFSQGASDVSSISKYSLRDDYVIYTNNQNPHGLCWSYAANMSLSTAIMKATGEYMDFSEAWVTTALNYICQQPEYQSIMSLVQEDCKIGDGGTFYIFDLLINDEKQEAIREVLSGLPFYLTINPFIQGVVLESDLNTSDLMSICNQNVNELYNFYSKYANTEIMENVISGRFGNYTDSSFSGNKKSMINAIKSHIKNHGSVSGSMNWANSNATVDHSAGYTYKVKDCEKNGQSVGGHAISLIGWDDTITVNGEKGAWIGLNSWGDTWGQASEFYISYNDTDFKDFYAYKYKASTADLYFSSKIVKADGAKYYEDYPNLSGAKQTKNIFYNNQLDSPNYNITYGYSTNANENEIGVKVYHYDEDVTNKFICTLSKDLNQIAIAPSSDMLVGGQLPVGTYKVVTSYESLDGTQKEDFVNAFYVMDGLELERLYISFSDMGAINNNGTIQIYNSYNYSNLEVNIATTQSEGSVKVYLIDALYSDIQTITYSPTSGVLLGNLVNYIGVVYKNSHRYTLPFKAGTYDYKLTLINSKNQSREINIHILKAGSSDVFADFKYDTNGGLNNQNNKERMLVGASGVKLYAPTKEGYIFKGWYTDESFTSALSKTTVGGVDAWTVLKSKVKTTTTPTRYSSDVESCSYVKLYAKWGKAPVYYTVTFNSLGGSIVNDITNAQEGKQIAKPADPTRSGYKFLGWYTSETFAEETKWNFATSTVTGNLELFAMWELIIPEYTVKIYDGNDQNPEGVIYQQGQKIAEPSTPYKEGHTFKGWYTTPNYETGTEWNFNEPIMSNISLYAKFEINTYTVTFCGDGIVTSNEVLYDVEYGTKITMPASGQKDGYTLEGWYTTSTHAEGTKWNFENSTVSSNINLYPKWVLENLFGVNITINPNNTQTYTKFNVVVKFNHKLEAEAKEVLLYKKLGQGSEFELVTTLTPSILETRDGELNYNYEYKYTATVSSEGTYYYYAIISYNIGSTTLTATTQSKSVIVTPKEVGIDKVFYNNNGKFTWIDDDVDASYVVSLIDESNNDAVVVTLPATANKQADVWFAITRGGQYAIKIEKYIDQIRIGEHLSEAFLVVELTYENILLTPISYNTVLVDKGLTVKKPDDLTFDGYNFKGWYTSQDYKTEWNFEENAVNENTTLYALWEIAEEISISNDIYTAEYVHTYDRNMHYTISAVAEHPLACTYAFVWYKKDGENNIMVSDGVDLKYSKVADSGIYFYEVTITDKNGFSKTKISDDINVEILRAPTIIYHGNMRKDYTYSGGEQLSQGKQYISGTVSIKRDDEVQEVEIVSGECVEIYEDGQTKQVEVTNYFTEVPEDGRKLVYLRVKQSENYEGAIDWFYVKINKADSQFTRNDEFLSQSFVYNGKSILPDYQLNNDEQQLECSVEIKDVGTYTNVKLTAKESKNYKSSNIFLDVEVKPAKIKLKAKDLYSIWLLDLKNYDAFEVIGDYYDNAETIKDDLHINILCSAEKTKLGKFDIVITANNPNYEIEIINGTYTISGTPYFMGLGLLIIIVAIWVILHKKKRFYIEFIENGGSIVKPIETNKKYELKIEVPIKDGCNFDGWYLDEEFTTPFRYKFKRGKQTILYAKWSLSDDYRAYQDEHDQVRQILKDLNIVNDEINEPQEEIFVEDLVVEELPKQKTEQEKMLELISGVKSSGPAATDDDIDNLIGFVTHKEYVRPKAKQQPKEEKPKTQEEILNELLAKAAQSNANASKEDINNLINNISDKHEQ